MTSADLLEQVLDAADRTWPDQLEALADRIGPELADIVIAEIADRAVLHPGPKSDVAVALVLLTSGRELHRTLLAGPAPRPDHSATATVTIRCRLAETAHRLYGAGATPVPRRSLNIDEEPGPATDAPDDPWMRNLALRRHAAGQILAAIDRPHLDLDRLARHFDADKWGNQLYTPKYETHLAPYRDRRIRLLEIGVGGFAAPAGGGESLRMWKHYLRRGLIHGIDIFPKPGVEESRIRTVVADQQDSESLVRVAERFGPFDVIIDDGSHISDHVTNSFRTLFPLLRWGGLYVIEDLQTAYWSGWNGGRPRDDPETATGMVKALVDDLHWQDQSGAESEGAQALARDIGGLHVYHNIVFITKEWNREPTAPSWVRREVNDMDLVPAGSMRRDAPLTQTAIKRLKP